MHSQIMVKTLKNFQIVIFSLLFLVSSLSHKFLHEIENRNSKEDRDEVKERTVRAREGDNERDVILNG